MNRTFKQAMIAICGVIACRAAARADNLPYPHGLPLEDVTEAVVCAQLKVPADAVFQAYLQYLGDAEKSILAADAEYVKLVQQARATPAALMGVQDTKRYNALEEMAEEVGRSNVNALVERLAAAAAPAQEERVAAIRQALQIAQAHLQIRGGSSGMIYVNSPETLWSSVSYHTASLDDSQLSALLPVLMEAQTANAIGRLAAMRGFQDASRSLRLEAAKRTEDANAVGKASASPDNATTMEIWKLLRGPSIESVAYRNLVKEEVKVFDEIQARLPDPLRAKLARSWYPQVIGEGYVGALDLPVPAGEHGTTPEEFVRAVLSLKKLSTEERDSVRRVGRAWIGEDLAILKWAVEATIAGSEAPDTKVKRQALADRALADLSKCASLTSLGGSPNSFPISDRVDQLETADATEFGQLWKSPPATEDLTRRIAKAMGRPWMYSQDMMDDLSALLKLSEAQSAVMDVAMADARQDWNSTVAPLVEASYEPAYGHREGEPGAERDAWLEKFKDSFVKWDQACVAAAACDDKLFAALSAAFQGHVDVNALDLALAGRRTGEGSFKMDRTSSAPVTAQPLDVPRAVLTAPLSADGRKAALAAAAPSAAKWKKLGTERAAANRRRRLEQIMPPQAQHHADDRAPEGSDGRTLVEEWGRVNQEWATQEKLDVDAIGGALTGADVGAWRTAVQRMRWPECYPSMRDLRRHAEKAAASAPSASEIVPRVDAMLEDAEQEAARSGDAAVAMMTAFPEQDEASRTLGLLAGRANADRLRALRTLDYPRYVALTERVRALLPPESLESIRRTTACKRLVAFTSAR